MTTFAAQKMAIARKLRAVSRLPLTDELFRVRLEPSMPRIVLAGRYKGVTYNELVTHQRPYCLWVTESDCLPTGLQPFKSWLKSRHGGVMAVGKHKLRFYREIVDEDPSYAVWAIGSILIEHKRAHGPKQGRLWGNSAAPNRAGMLCLRGK